MSDSEVGFEAYLVASTCALAGTKHLIVGMTTMLSGAAGLAPSSSVPATIAVGLALVSTGGLVAAGSRSGRVVGIVAQAGVLAVSLPTLFGDGIALAGLAAAPITAAEAGVAVLLFVYLLFRNPLRRPERSEVDSSTSASRIGSTLR